MKLTDKETAIILAALRFTQRRLDNDGGLLNDLMPEFFEDFGDETDSTDIDDLCERINTD